MQGHGEMPSLGSSLQAKGWSTPAPALHSAVSSRSTSLVQPVPAAGLSSPSWFWLSCVSKGTSELLCRQRGGWGEEFTEALSSAGLWRICKLPGCLHRLFCAAVQALPVVWGQGWRQRSGSAQISGETEIAVWGSCTVKEKGRAHFLSLQSHPFPPSPCNYLLQAVFPLDYLQRSSTKSIEKQARTGAEGFGNFSLMSWRVPSQFDMRFTEMATRPCVFTTSEEIRFLKVFSLLKTRSVQEAPGFRVS